MSAERISEKRLAEIRSMADESSVTDEVWDTTIRDLLRHIHALSQDTDRLTALREADHKWRQQVRAEVEEHAARRVTQSTKQHTQIKTLESQVHHLKQQMARLRNQLQIVANTQPDPATMGTLVWRELTKRLLNETTAEQ